MLSFAAEATREGAGGPWAFTTIGTGARAMGLGGAVVAIADDSTATYWNPAGLGFVTDRYGATLMKVIFPESSSDLGDSAIGGEHSYISGHIPLLKGDLGASTNLFTLGGITYTIANQTEQDYILLAENQGTTHRAYTLAYALPISRPISKNWISIGVSVKYFQENILGFSASGFGADFGFITKRDKVRIPFTKLVIKNLRGGYTFQIDPKHVWKDKKDRPEGIVVEAPLDEDGLGRWRWGLALDAIHNSKTILTTAIAFTGRERDAPIFLSVGAELWLFEKVFAIRGGIDDLQADRRDAKLDPHPRWSAGVSFRIPPNNALPVVPQIPVGLQADFAWTFEALTDKLRASITLIY